MRILLDEDLPHKLRLALPEHDVGTTAYAGFDGLLNGALLRAAEGSGFDLFLTADRNMPNQQNLRGRSLAIIVLTTVEGPVMQPYLSLIAEAIGKADAGSLQHIECGRFSRKLKED